MKQKLLYFAALLVMVLSACSSQDEPSRPQGSYRDTTYRGDRCEVYVSGALNTGVSEVQVVSYHIPADELEANAPYLFDTVMKIKGFLKKNKVTEIEVKSNVDDFEGESTVDGRHYRVSGHFEGDPFRVLPEQMSIVVYFEEQ